MNSSPLDRDDVETVLRALNGCANDLMSTPPDDLAPEYAQELENLGRGGGARWPDTGIIGRDLLSIAAELEPGSFRLPESITFVLRTLAAAALQRFAIGIEQEMRGALEADVKQGERLAVQALGLTVRVDARRWSGGRELCVLGSADLVTQVEDVDGAPVMVRDLLETEFPGADFSKVDFDVRIVE